MPKAYPAKTRPRVPLGIEGLDDVLGGGLPAERLYLVQGPPGVGKTTLALQFLLEGVARGERVLYITLSETEEEVRNVAESHGWTLDGMDMYELASAEQTLRLDKENTLYVTAEVELKETMRVLLAEVERREPVRIVFDSLSEIRTLAQNSVRYRRQLLALKQFFTGRKCTVLLLDDRSGGGEESHVESIVHGVVALERVPISYGPERRRLRIAKLRGARFRSGYHDFTVRTGGLVVYPRLVAVEHRTDFRVQPISTGIAGLDALLGGGVDRGTALLLTGPAGTGKSAITAHIACAAASEGHASAMFIFEERLGTLLVRSENLGAPLRRYVDAGTVRLHQIDPAELAPDEFTSLVRRETEAGAKLIVLDSLTGYFAAMPDARFLTLQMHELLAFLGERGVATILTLPQSGAFQPQSRGIMDASYLADTIVLLRYFEMRGRICKAVSVMKKRSGAHEDSIRELRFGDKGIEIGAPLAQFRGIMAGAPLYDGSLANSPAQPEDAGD